MDHSKKTTYLFSFDVLRVIAILAVILVHQTTTTLQVLDHNVFLAPFTLFLNQAARFAVPMLFLISGFVLELNNKNNFSYRSFFKKRASRILVPYIFWSILYFSVWQGFSLNKLISYDFLYHLFYGTAGYHLYFIPTLIIFYLAFPFLHKFVNLIKKPSFLAFVFVLQIGISFYNYYFQVIPIQESLRVALLTFSLFILGIGSAHHKESILRFAEHYFKVIVASTTLLLFGIFVHVFSMTVSRSSTGFIYNQYGPLNYFYTLLLAIGLVNLFEKKNYFKKVIVNLSKLSFFVFFVHVFVLQFLWENILTNLNSNLYKNFIFDISVFAMVASICFLFAFVMHKIPYATKITG